MGGARCPNDVEPPARSICGSPCTAPLTLECAFLPFLLDQRFSTSVPQELLKHAIPDTKQSTGTAAHACFENSCSTSGLRIAVLDYVS